MVFGRNAMVLWLLNILRDDGVRDALVRGTRLLVLPTLGFSVGSDAEEGDNVRWVPDRHEFRR